MDEKKPVSDIPEPQPEKVLPSVPGVYPSQHKVNSAVPPPKDYRQAEQDKARIKAEWEAQQAEKKKEERKKAEEERLKAEREALYQDLETLDYELLSLSEYPSDFEVESARRSRMGWFFGLGIAVFLFTSSLLNLVHPWVGGIAGGLAFVLWLSHGTGMMQFLPGLTRYPELLTQRRRLKNGVTEYIQHLEGKRGFIHRLYPLVHHNPRLRARKFRRIALQSKEHNLMSNMKTLQDVALYHEYIEECRKAAQEYFQKEREDRMLEDLDIDPNLDDPDQDVDEDAASGPVVSDSPDSRPLKVTGKKIVPDAAEPKSAPKDGAVAHDAAISPVKTPGNAPDEY